jgi:hypothetical protein
VRRWLLVVVLCLPADRGGDRGGATWSMHGAHAPGRNETF